MRQQHIKERQASCSKTVLFFSKTSTLLTCFFSYSYAGLMQSGVGGYLTGLQFPVTGEDIMHKNFWKIIFEILFAFGAGVVVSIITGIICDTFGELRGDQDEAADFQATTNFITGVPFAECAEEKSTNFLQYTYMMLYLRQRREKDLTPLERMVRPASHPKSPCDPLPAELPALPRAVSCAGNE